MSAPADPYTAKAEKTPYYTPQQKIDSLKTILEATTTAMFVTRNSDNELHSRAMSVASWENHRFQFLANNQTHKFEELEFDPHVNISFYDPSTTNWASVSGKAKLHQDKELIKSLFSFPVKAWFGDLGDGVHTGDYDDPRVSAIEVVPTSIRFWIARRSGLGQAVEILTSAFTGETAAPGDLMTITNEEIQLVCGLQSKAT